MGQGRTICEVAAHIEATRFNGGNGSWEDDSEREVGGHGERILEEKLHAGGHVG